MATPARPATSPRLPVDGLRASQRGWLLGLLGLCFAGHMAHTVLTTQTLATQLLSPGLWSGLVTSLRGATLADGFAQVPLAMIITCTALSGLLVWGIATFCSRAAGAPLWNRANRTAFSLGRWLLILAAWEWCWVASSVLAGSAGVLLLTTLLPSWLTLGVAGLVAVQVQPQTDWQSLNRDRRSHWPRLIAWLAALSYLLIFGMLNWRLYSNLFVPHGDSAMYEEHLWNILHGKGFRSYLDQGLFLGEHIQIVHLLLLPIYLVSPWLPTLDWCSSISLAAGSWPVWRMIVRQTGRRDWAAAGVIAYLLYTPLQYLDIEIDLKTFRPESFGIPLLLAALDSFDARRWKSGLAWSVFVLTVKEDFTLVLAPLGLYYLIQSCYTQTEDVDPAQQQAAVRHGHRNPGLYSGALLLVGSTAYLVLATKVLIPWFRAGEQVHYASYFSALGANPNEVVQTVLLRPQVVFWELSRISTILYGLALLVPLGGLPLWGWRRLLVGFPLFCVLCLNEVARDPRHHFHAPLVAIVFWALAEALGRFSRDNAREPNSIPTSNTDLDHTIRASLSLPRWLVACAFFSGLMNGLSPLSLAFWDSSSAYHWKQLYAPSDRGPLWEQVKPLIPINSRVAATDYVHTRLTHHERSYDYSSFARKVAGWKQGAPPDADYLVIDTHHPYSELKHPTDVPEYRDHPQQWKLIPNASDGMFLLFQRQSGEGAP